MMSISISNSTRPRAWLTLSTWLHQSGSISSEGNFTGAPSQYRKSATAWLVAGLAFAALVASFGWDKQLYVLGFGLAYVVHRKMRPQLAFFV